MRANVVGSGPNGLAAAIALAQAGYGVTVFEGATHIGGGMRSEPLTLPGFTHDVCSSVYPFAAASPFFRSLRLEEVGLRWAVPPIALAHPFDDGTAALGFRSLRETAEGFGEDGSAYLRLMEPLVENAGMLLRHLLGPVRMPPAVLPFARFAARGVLPARTLLDHQFKGEKAKALIAGSATHSMLSLEEPATAAFGLLLTMCIHLNGWPFTRGGAQALADALAAKLQTLGGRIETGRWIRDVDEVRAEKLLLDVSPWMLLDIAHGRLPDKYVKALRKYKLGHGVIKVDYALDAPVPWKCADVARAGTVHLGGTLDDIVRSEAAVAAEGVSDDPFVIVAQPTVADPSRAPEGKHVLWTYMHVPNGYSEDVSDLIDRQIERFAPGFSSRILARHVMLPKDFEEHNPSCVGGDISTGSQDLTQLFTRPLPSTDPYRTPIDGVYLCSAATPPGSGVHGMCGYRAALSAMDEPLLRRIRRRLP